MIIKAVNANESLEKSRNLRYSHVASAMMAWLAVISVTTESLELIGATAKYAKRRDTTDATRLRR